MREPIKETREARHMKRRVFELRWVGSRWAISERRGDLIRSFPGLTKETSVRLAAGIVREYGLAQLVVYNKHGRISFERTYPRSSDPRRHKG